MEVLNAVQLKKYYVDWLNEEIKLNKLNNNYIEITSPLLDINNDYQQVYVNISNPNELCISDDGYTINNLYMLGIDIKTGKRKELLNQILKKFGVHFVNNEILVYCNSHDFAQKLFLLSQAMSKIEDMFMLSKNKVASFFQEDVKNYLNKHEIYYSQDVNFIGKSGLLHSYDFLFQKTKTKHERLCQTINNPDMQSFKNCAFSWNDTKDKRDKNSEFIVLLNDKKSISQNVLNAFNNYDIKTILWSQIDKNIDLLTA